MTEIRKMEKTTPDDYAAMGFRCGLEIHQQLDTEKKLFCRCPVRPYTEEYNAEILRHMRPTLSELGEYDGTALMEFKTKKNIIYQIHQDTVCTYEMDDTPPFELNRQALEIALEITMMLNCNLVSEVHISRKQYLDGSIPTGFQRTTILGIDGWIPYMGRRIRIVQLGLEEDACREVSDAGHYRTFKTDRLGIPLIETVTYPDMRTPAEAAGVAQILRWLVRSTGKVRRGIGAGRQDVNVSVEGGRRVEIKGVHRIPLIPALVHNEAFRQLALLEIKRELEGRGVDQPSCGSEIHDVTEILRGTRYHPVAGALEGGLQVRAVVLRGYRGILTARTQPETTFAREISDRVRVIACLDQLPNIAHSDMEGETLSSMEWTKIKKKSGIRENDAVVIVWGNGKDVETGAREVAIRAAEALDGVPNETRQALPDGTTGFERILPGPDRMYPDTDLPPIAVTSKDIESIGSRLPEPPWEREKRYAGLGLSPDLARRMSIAEERDLFDRSVKETPHTPAFLASLLLDRVRPMLRDGRLPNFEGGSLVSALREAGERGLGSESTLLLIEKVCGTEPKNAATAAGELGIMESAGCRREIESLFEAGSLPPLPEAKLKRHVMGQVMERCRGRLEGKAAASIVDSLIGKLK